MTTQNPRIARARLEAAQTTETPRGETCTGVQSVSRANGGTR